VLFAPQLWLFAPQLWTLVAPDVAPQLWTLGEKSSCRSNLCDLVATIVTGGAVVLRGAVTGDSLVTL
jgi:N-acyl-D-aspartate/D-glutamate deacylase